jgi:hypothetical protein
MHRQLPRAALIGSGGTVQRLCARTRPAPSPRPHCIIVERLLVTSRPPRDEDEPARGATS